MKALKSVWLFNLAVHVAMLMSVISRELIYPSCVHSCDPDVAELKPVGIACSEVEVMRLSLQRI